MTVEEVFTKLAKHMVEGMMYHDTFTKGYDFLGLYGFAKCHEYHHIEETKDYLNLLHYYSTRYHKLLMIKEIPEPNIIPPDWYKYTTMDVDTNTKRNAVKTMMEKWIEWERKTKTLYQEMHQELCNLGEVAAANEVKCYICAVDEELKHAEKKLIKLTSVDYNINTIINWQQPMYKKFKKELKNIFE